MSRTQVYHEWMRRLRPAVKSGVLLCLLVAAGFGARAQQDPMYTQYMNNILSVNPAYASVSSALEVVAISRNQWTGIDGAPVTQSLSAMMPIKGTDSGIGVTMLTDKIGPVRQSGLYLDYSYRLRLGYRTYFAWGLKTGINFYHTDYSILEVNDGGDPVLSEDVVRKFLPNAGIGAFFYTERLFVGLSVPKLITNRINEVGYSTQFSAREEIHFFLMGGYVFDLNDFLKFKPYALVKMVPNAPLSADVSAHFLLYDRVWLGANWRIGDAVGAIAQFYVSPQFKLGYAYDITASDLNSFNRGTHEVLVSYAFNLGRRRFISPRYF